MDVELLVERGVLVPREETELLGNTALERLPDGRARDRHVLRLGQPRLRPRHAVAARAHLGVRPHRRLRRTGPPQCGICDVHDRVAVAQGDLFAGLSGHGLEGWIDAVVCNPPYISQAKLAGERAALLENEPREAFDGGPYGLSIHQRMVKEALPFLKPGGSLLFEIGLGQERQVKMLFERTRAYEEIRTVANAAGEVRVVAARKINPRGK